MLDNSHETLSPPPANCTLWRYMDLAKFLSLLESRSLHFPRADQFQDPYEGAWSRAGIRLFRESATSSGLPEGAVDQFIGHADDFRRQMYISCWFMGEHESAAMWKLYLQSPEGVAIKTDVDTLVEGLEQSPLTARTTMVKYVDYDTTPIPFGNLLFPFVHKRLSFSHEAELRAIIWAEEASNRPQIATDATAVMIGVAPEQLIKAVHVSPTAPRWFGALIEQVVKRYSLALPVVRSSLYDRPSY
jgi:hypothetical protein